MLEIGKLPNLRKFIVPDPGMVIVDMDLERADLYAVAWDANCQKLKDRLRYEDVHTRHAIEFMGKSTKYERDLMKKLAHAADYLVGVRTASIDTGLPEKTIQRFLDYWFFTYPEVGGYCKDDNGNLKRQGWHARVEKELLGTRMIKNIWGYRRPFFDRPGECLPEAVAWIPQSTVGIIINKALCNIAENLPQVQLLLQVHDSLTMQVPEALVDTLIPQIKQQSLIRVPYPDPLIIPVSFKVSGISWGDVKEWTGATSAPDVALSS